jgi:uncharacterized phage-associated protein
MLREVNAPPYYEEKLEELVLYVAEKTRGDANAGAVKLNKYLYFSDFAAMRKHGRPITGAEYQRLLHGPAPRRLRPVRDRLVATGAARVDERVDAFGYVHHDLVALRPARVAVFTSTELAIIDYVIAALRPLSAADVSALSHREAGWQLVADNGVIPYELAYVVAPGEAQVTPTARAEAERVFASYRDRLA